MLRGTDHARRGWPRSRIVAAAPVHATAPRELHLTTWELTSRERGVLRQRTRHSYCSRLGDILRSQAARGGGVLTTWDGRRMVSCCQYGPTEDRSHRRPAPWPVPGPSRRDRRCSVSIGCLRSTGAAADGLRRLRACGGDGQMRWTPAIRAQGRMDRLRGYRASTVRGSASRSLASWPRSSGSLGCRE
jgi:hypothetical protein